MLVSFSVSPLGKGESVSEFVAPIIDIIEKSGLPNKTNPMGTVVEGSWDEVMELVKKCHDAVLDNSARVITNIKIDDRPGKPNRMEGKIKSVEEKLGRKINT